MANTPRILMLSPVLPNESGSGLEKRCAIFLDALERVGLVDLFVLPISDISPVARAHFDDRDQVTLLPSLSRHLPDTQFSLISRLKHQEDWLKAFAAYGRPSLSALVSNATVEALASHLGNQQYDLVHVARSYVAPFALELVHRMRGTPPSLSLDLDEDDASAFAMQSKMLPTGSFSAKKALLEAIAFERLIKTIAPKFNQIWASSDVECQGLNRRYTIASQPVSNAITPCPSAPRNSNNRRILFVGSMEHPFNVDAAHLLIDRVWSQLAGKGLQLDIVGKSPPDDLMRRASRPGVNIHGWVPNLAPVYRSAAAFVAPIQFGAGTRFKVAEAAAYNVPIVATPKAVEGLGLYDQRDLWIAHTPDATARAVLSLLNHPHEAARRSQNARKAAVRNLDRSRILANLAQRIATMLDSKPQT